MSNNPHADDCGFALYGPPALCTCRAAWLRSDGIAEIRAVAGRISDVDDHVTVHQAADEIERLRADDPHGLPWRVAPWGDGSSDTGNSNIISDRWQVVIASEMPTETAEFIVASVRFTTEAAPAAEHPSPSRSEVLEVAAKIADEFADMFRTEPPYSDSFWAGANIAKAIRALKDVRPDDRSAAG